MACRQAIDDAIQEKRRAREQLRSKQPKRVSARKEYARTPAGKDASTRARRSYCTRNPEKHAAHIAVRNAIRDGRLTRQPCEKCGAKAEAHHDDYSQPLSVRWLCDFHHKEHHRGANFT